MIKNKKLSLNKATITNLSSSLATIKGGQTITLWIEACCCPVSNNGPICTAEA